MRAERPVLESNAKSQEVEFNTKWGLPLVSKDGSGQSNYND